MTTVSRGRGTVLLAALLAVVLALLAIGNRASGGGSFSPHSTSENGTRAMVRLLEDSGVAVEVRTGVPGPGDDIALILSDRFVTNDDELQVAITADLIEIGDWVASGGTLIVADPASGLLPSQDRGNHQGGADCEVAALVAIRSIDLERSEGFDMSSAGDRRVCFAGSGQAAVVVADRGVGAVVGFGLRDAWRNDRIGRGDHAKLAVAILAPRQNGSVVILEGPTFATGDESLAELVPAGVKWGLGLAAVAFLIYAVGQSRRHGRPVREPQQVTIAGSELVVAVGKMLERSRAPENAAMSLRDEARRRLAEALKLPRNTPVDEVTAALAARPGIKTVDIEAALGAGPVSSEADLLRLAASIDQLQSQLVSTELPTSKGVPL